MVMKINKEILNYIRKSEYDENTQKFLIQALMLEFKRDKEDLRNYSKDYNDLIDNYI